MAGDGMHQIGEVVEAVGLSLRTVRYYDEVGLVPPSGRTPGGFRLYTDGDIERLTLVKHMKPLDFRLEEMRDLLRARDRLADADAEADERAELEARLGMYATLAEERCERLREQLAAAETMAAMIRRDARRRRTAGRRAR